MGLDQELLNRNSQTSAEKVASLNQARRSSAREEVDSNDLNSSESEEGFDFNTVRHRAQLNKLAKEKKNKKGVGTIIASPINKSTSKLLQQAWLNLIDSFGLTLIWINIHVFLNLVLGSKLFCKLGDEWTAGSSFSLGNTQASKKLKKVKIGEGMLLVILDIIVIFLILFFFFLIYLIFSGDTLVTFLKGILEGIWGLFSGGSYF